MSELRALIFDVDGTLADTERDGHRVAFNQAFADADLMWEWSPHLYGRLLAVTGGRERIRHYIEDYDPPFDPPADLDGFIAALHRAKTKIYSDLVANGVVEVRPGIARLIEEARDAGLKLAIATTTSRPNVIALLDHSFAPGAVGWFDVIATANEAPSKKPASDVFLYTVRELGLHRQSCIAFEDSQNGVRAAVAAGIDTIVTLNDYTRDDDFSGARLVIDTLGEPNQPMTVLAGDALGGRYIDVPLLRRLHEKWHGGGS